MVTARSPRTPRARSRAGLAQLLGLALLLLALVCAHGTGGSHSTTDHSTAGVLAAVTAPAHLAGPGDTTSPAATPPSGTATTTGPALRADAPRTSRTPSAPAGVGGAAVGRHDPAHPVHECAPLPPRTAHAVDAPTAPAAPLAHCAPAAAPTGPGTDRVAASPAGAAPPLTGSSAVLRV
ncbi:hypothetical protein [Streptomyces sp. NPDC001594]|uniref:hypothetical protein n=1 Tax=Streptomyces sp. NPDC001594 TaxID=3364590 RepID=UPI00367580C5